MQPLLPDHFAVGIKCQVPKRKLKVVRSSGISGKWYVFNNFLRIEMKQQGSKFSSLANLSPFGGPAQCRCTKVAVMLSFTVKTRQCILCSTSNSNGKDEKPNAAKKCYRGVFLVIRAAGENLTKHF